MYRVASSLAGDDHGADDAVKGRRQVGVWGRAPPRGVAAVRVDLSLLHDPTAM